MLGNDPMTSPHRVGSCLRRRQFPSIGASTLMGTLITRHLSRAGESKCRAVVIGYTGFGDYGHELERIFDRGPENELER